MVCGLKGVPSSVHRREQYKSDIAETLAPQYAELEQSNGGRTSLMPRYFPKTSEALPLCNGHAKELEKIQHWT